MSFGSETGRARSGSKGFSNKEKKLKKKKQDYHVRRRAQLQEADSLDTEQVRTRTVIALDRLGHQILSGEPGGYDLEAWMRSFNSLLDDFQEKVGTDHITEEFRTRRQEAVRMLATPTRSSDLDSQISKLTGEEEDAEAALVQAEKNAETRLASLRQERDNCVKELKAERERLAEIREAKESRQFFSRVFRPGPSTQQAEEKVAALESKLKTLEDDIERSRKARAIKSTEPGQGDPAYLEAERNLEQVRGQLLALRTARQNSLMLTRERETATQLISGMISSMKLDEAAPEAGET